MGGKGRTIPNSIPAGWGDWVELLPSSVLLDLGDEADPFWEHRAPARPSRREPTTTHNATKRDEPMIMREAYLSF